MASEKKPSIYYDRGTIGSSDELDEYGVWVKGEPQDLSSIGAESQEFDDIPDPDLPDMADLPDFSAAGADVSEESAEAEDTMPEDTDLELPDIDFEDTVSEEETADFEESPADAGESAAEDTESFELSEFPEPDFSDFTEAEGGEAEELGFVEVSMDSGDDDPLPALDGSDEDGESGIPKEPKPSSTDLSTQLLMKIADELASIRTELSTLKSELAGMKAGGEAGDAQSRGFFDEEDDEKIALTGDELDNILNTADFTEEAGADATEDVGDDFDIQEAEDNSSDPFQEITETPAEEAGTGDILDDSLTDDGLTDNSLIDDGSTDGSSIDGSLTDNSLIDGSSTDDISSVDISIDDITKDLDLGLEEKDLDELGGEINFGQAEENAGEAPAGQDAILEEPVEFDITLDEDEAPAAENPFEEPPSEDLQSGQDLLPDLEIKDSEDLRQLREEGVQPMTPAPEDTSFLEEDPMAFSGFEGESLDLSNAVIEEPDLSADIQENPLQEPSLDDISIDLDLDEEISLDNDDVVEEELDGTGGIESSEESFEEEIELPVSGESPEIGAEIEMDDEAEVSAGAEDLALIPEGFVVEADNSGMPSIDEGEEAFSETEEPEEEAGEEPYGEESYIEESDDFIQEEAKQAMPVSAREDIGGIPSHLKQELKTVLSYMDQLLESLPDEKIEEFAKSEYFDTYKKLFKELGLV